MTYRDAVLQATMASERLHQELGTEARISAGSGRVDIFDVIQERDIFLLFRQLEGLLGAFLPAMNDPGILVTTQRPLFIQRFTAAHELGHAVLQHGLELDDAAMLTRTPFGQQSYDLKEMGADTFAAMFLMPDWLIKAQAVRHHWDSASSIRDPRTIYQLALRLGVSFEALIRTLAAHNIISWAEAKHLQTTTLKTIKQQLLPQDAWRQMPDWRGNVWVLTESDQGASVLAEPNDVFLVSIHEKSSAGYLWDRTALESAGFQVLTDARVAESPMDTVGEGVLRRIAVRSGSAEMIDVSMPLARPWNAADRVGSYDLSFNVRGREIGLPQTFREVSLAA